MKHHLQCRSGCYKLAYGQRAASVSGNSLTFKGPVRKTLIFFFLSISLLALSCVAGNTPAADLMADKEAVIRHYGPPSGSVTLGDKEILTYPQGKVILKDGKVISMDFSEPKMAPAKKMAFLQPLGGPFRLSYDPDIWVPQGSWGTDPSPLNVGLTHHTGDFYLTLSIGSKKIPKDYIAAGVLQYLQSLKQPVTVVRRDTRMIKGGEVIYLHLVIGTQALKMAQHHYIYSGPRGTATVLVVGPNNPINVHLKDVMAALNGLEVIDAPTAENPEEKPAEPKNFL
jgi:hypothetical protein